MKASALENTSGNVSMVSKTDRPLLGYFGHHKCGSTWFQVICGEVCRELKLEYRIVYRAQHVNNDLKSFVERNELDFVAYNNADYRQVQMLGPLKGFHVVRDPRDICVSAYFSHKHSHEVTKWPAMQKHRAQLQDVSEEEGILLEIDWLTEHFDEMRSWPREVDGMLQLKMEDLTTSPYQEMLKVFEFLDLVDEQDFTARKRANYFLSKLARKLEHVCSNKVSIPYALRRVPAERFLGLLWEHDFSRKTKGRKLGEEDVKSHYRKGQAGDWRNHFTPRHVEYFKEKCNDLLLHYGYELTPDWAL